MRAFAFSQQGLSVREALREAVLTLQRAHVKTASLDARLLLEYVMDISRERLLLLCDHMLTVTQENDYRTIIARRAARQPVAQLVGVREFWGMNFVVTSDTLDPRADSETLIESILIHTANRQMPISILDLGTGTGCLLLSLLKEFPQAIGLGIDSSVKALAVAQKNAQALHMAERASFMQSRWAEKVSGTFDIIISNPPYIETGAIATLAPEVAQFEPKLALDGGIDGLDAYRDIMPSIPALLKTEGIAAFEIGLGQQSAFMQLAQENTLRIESVNKDMQGIVRCILIKHLKEE